MSEHVYTACVVGLGYIGLPTAITLASNGINTVGCDINLETVNAINGCKSPIVEPKIEEALTQAIIEGNLRAQQHPCRAEIFIIAVPTPLSEKTKEPDLTYVLGAIRSICGLLKVGDLIIIESTIPVGSTDEIAKLISKQRPELVVPTEGCDHQDIYIAHCPERVLPGDIMRELTENDRVIGGITPRCAVAAKKLYERFVLGECIVASSARTAELTKLAENSYRDINIAFANELSIICDTSKIDVWEVIRLANRHPRVDILQPGPGVGGHCIAVDPWFIVSKNPYEAKIIRKAREINDAKPEWVINKVKLAVNEYKQIHPNEEDTQIAIYGVTFKANSDDLRESPSLEIALSLHKSFSNSILIIDPFVSVGQLRSVGLKKVDYAFAHNNAQIHVMLVDHSEFLKELKPKGIIVDTKGVW